MDYNSELGNISHGTHLRYFMPYVLLLIYFIFYLCLHFFLINIIVYSTVHVLLKKIDIIRLQ